MVSSGGYHFDEAKQIVLLNDPSLASLADAIALSARLVQDPRLTHDVGFVVDFRGMSRLLQFDEIYNLLDWHKSRHFPLRGRCAFIVDRPATIGTANIFCSLLRLQSIEAEMFDDEASAEAWLALAPRMSGAYSRRPGTDGAADSERARVAAR
jgi:hypothetical protein